MLLTMYYLKDCTTRLNNLLKQLKKLKDEKETGDDFEVIKSNFYGISLEMLNALSECSFGLHKSYMFTGTLTTLKTMIKMVQNANDKNILIEVIESILAPYHEYDFNSISAYNYKDNFRYAHSYGETHVEQQVIEEIVKSIQLPNDRIINVIDPLCRQGNNAEKLGACLSNVNLWGVGLSEKNIANTKKKFFRIALGPLKGTSISNDVFDILLLQPEISLERKSDVLLEKKEKELLQKTVHYLRPGGIMVLILPYFRFYKDICLFLAKNFTNLQIKKYKPSLYFRDNAFVYVTGVKKPDKELDENSYNLLRHSYDIDNISDIMESPFQKNILPPNRLEVKFFRGSVLDYSEINRLYETSNCVSQFWNAQKIEKLSENTKNPLLPFNVGQLGLVLTSGCLDGEVQEKNGCYHVVKGRVVKKIDSAQNIDIENNQVEVIETTSNRVEINVFLPDGTHKILA